MLFRFFSGQKILLHDLLRFSATKILFHRQNHVEKRESSALFDPFSSFWANSSNAADAPGRAQGR